MFALLRDRGQHEEAWSFAEGLLRDRGQHEEAWSFAEGLLRAGGPRGDRWDRWSVSRALNRDLVARWSFAEASRVWRTALRFEQDGACR